MKTIIVLFISLVTVVFAQAAEIASFQKGNDAYLKNNFSDAIKSYQELVNDGYQSSEIYFNLGNAYYKSDSLASAILYYEKAKKLNPDDDDIIVNLKLANLKTIDKTDAKEELIFKSWWDKFLNSRTADGWGILCIVSLFIAFVLLTIFRISVSSTRKQILFIGFSLFLVCSLSFFLLAKLNYTHQTETGQAILFSSSATIKSAPTENSKDLFVIHEGAKVNIIEKNNSWFRIRLDNGNEGWITESSVKII